MTEKKPPLVESLAPARNFTIRLEDRVRAAAGPPAYMRRLRHIEDLEAGLLRALSDVRARVAREAESAGKSDANRDVTSLRTAIIDEARARRIDVREVNRLIGNHNRYYPIEANLPIHPRTGLLHERGQPWRPRELLSIEALVDRILEEAQSA